MSQWLPKSCEVDAMSSNQPTLYTSSERLPSGCPFPRPCKQRTENRLQKFLKQFRGSSNTQQPNQSCGTVFLSKMVVLETQGGIRSIISLGCLCFILMSSELPCWNTKYGVEKKAKMVFGGGEVQGKRELRTRINLRGRRKLEKAANQLLNSSATENTICIAFTLLVSASPAFQCQ